MKEKNTYFFIYYYYIFLITYEKIKINKGIIKNNI